MFLYFYIVIVKCYHTAIQCLGNVTLFLVVTLRTDKKQNLPSSGFILFVCLFWLRLYVPVNNFSFMPPLPGYYEYLFGR